MSLVTATARARRQGLLIIGLNQKNEQNMLFLPSLSSGEGTAEYPYEYNERNKHRIYV